MNFLLWTKGSHENTNVDTAKCSDENLPNSSSHFPNHKSVFLQILHDSSVSWKVTPLYLFRSKVVYFAQKRLIKVHIFFWLFSARIKVHQIIVIFETKNRFFYKFSTILWYHETYFLDTFFCWNFIYSQQKKSIKVENGWSFTWAIKRLNFRTVVGYFFKNHIKFSYKSTKD